MSHCVKFAVLLALFFSSGCSVMQSSLDLSEPGINYFLPKTLVDVLVVATTPDYEKPTSAFPLMLDGKPYAITLATSTVPDLRHQYRLNYERNIFFHDRLCVSTQANGLLNSVEIATEDATPQILVALAALAGTFSGGPSFRVANQDERPDAARVVFDPFDNREVVNAETYLTKKLRLSKRLRMDLQDLRLLADQGRSKCEGKGVCFRTAVKVPVRIGQTPEHAPAQYIEVVNQSHIGHMELERAILIENILALGFENGALTHVMMRRPSQALQAVKLPLAVTNALLAVPGDFLGRIGGNATTLSALNTESTNRASVENTIQTRLSAIESNLSSRVPGASTSEASTFTLRCRGVVNRAS